MKDLSIDDIKHFTISDAIELPAFKQKHEEFSRLFGFLEDAGWIKLDGQAMSTQGNCILNCWEKQIADEYSIEFSIEAAPDITIEEWIDTGYHFILRTVSHDCGCIFLDISLSIEVELTQPFLIYYDRPIEHSFEPEDIKSRFHAAEQFLLDSFMTMLSKSQLLEEKYPCEPRIAKD
jgi:hypothetical protein